MGSAPSSLEDHLFGPEAFTAVAVDLLFEVVLAIWKSEISSFMIFQSAHNLDSHRCLEKWRYPDLNSARTKVGLNEGLRPALVSVEPLGR